MKIVNRRAYYNYQILDKFEAGIKLSGAEVKSVKLGHITLDHSFVKILGSESYLINANIHPYIFARRETFDPKRTRKLLLHTKEIISLKSKMQSQNLAIVPLSCYTKQGFIKLELGIGRGKKKWDKRKAIKERDRRREVGRIS